MVWHKMYMVYYIACMECKKILRSSKIVVLGMCLIFMHILVLEPLQQCAIKMDGKLSVFEPFVALGNSGTVVLLLPLFFLTMISEYPQEDTAVLYYRIRCSKKVWIWGELLFALVSAVLLTAFSCVASMLMLIPYGEWNLKFSDAITKYVSVFPECRNDYVVELIPANLYNQMTLYKAVIHTATLLVLYFWVLALILLLFSLGKNKKAGVMLDGTVIMGGAIFCAARSRYMWLFPMAHTIPWLHYTEYFSEEIVPMTYSYFYFMVLVVMLAVGCFLVGKRNGGIG